MSIRLTHVRVNVTDLETALAWYEWVLGFPAEGHWPSERPGYAHFATPGGMVFAIMETEPVPTAGRFNFAVDDVDSLWSRLSETEISIVEPLSDTPWGSRKFTIHDPDGTELGFVQE